MSAQDELQKKVILYAGIAAGILFIIGIALIVQSNIVYNDSIHYVATAITADTALRGKILSLPNYTTVKEGYSEALLFFMLALGIVILAALLPRLQTFTISPTGGVNITLKDLQQQVDDLKAQNNDLTQKAVNIDSDALPAEEKLKAREALSGKRKELEAEHPDDPQKGKWGGNSTANGRALTATVKATALPGWYHVNLKVASTNENPLTGLVTFHLHDTFLNPDPVISVINGEANLSLKMVYGAFTVGAVADGGKTKLELDLAELPGIPEKFRDS